MKLRNPFGHSGAHQSLDFQSAEFQVRENKDAPFVEVESFVVGLLGLAEHEISWTTGLYTITHSETVAASVQRAAEKIKSFRIIVDPETNIEQARKDAPWLFDLAKQGKIDLSVSTVPIPHWLIVDRRHARLEMPHPINTYGKDNHMILKPARRC